MRLTIRLWNYGLEYTWNNMASVRMGTHLGHDTAGMSFGLA